MAITELYTGSATISTSEISCVSGTSTLSTDTTDGVFSLWLDVSAVTTADLFIVQAYEKVRSTGTKRVFWQAYLSGSEEVFTMPPVVLMNGWDFTLTKISGTDRAIEWSIRQVA